MRTFFLYGIGVLATTSSVLAQVETVVHAERLITGTGVVHEPGMLFVRDGKIAAVGATVDVPETAHVLRHEGTMMPGMIDLALSPGGPGATNEAIVPASPTLRALDGLDPWNPQFETWARDGVTTVQVAPFPGTTVSGLAGVTKTAGAPGTRTLAPASSLRVSLNARGRSGGRAPTALMGAMVMLRDLFATGTEAPVAQARAGTLPLFCDVDGFVEVRAALALASAHGLRLTIVAPTHPGEVHARVNAAGFPLVLGPLTYDASERQLRSYGTLRRSDVPLGFASAPGGAADRPALRRTAALAVREGMDPALALRALTLDAARILGVEARVGSLEVGKDADFLWLDGDPLDLGTRVEAVFVDGVRVDISQGE